MVKLGNLKTKNKNNTPNMKTLLSNYRLIIFALLCIFALKSHAESRPDSIIQAHPDTAYQNMESLEQLHATKQLPFLIKFLIIKLIYDLLQPDYGKYREGNSLNKAPYTTFDLEHDLTKTILLRNKILTDAGFNKLWKEIFALAVKPDTISCENSSESVMCPSANIAKCAAFVYPPFPRICNAWGLKPVPAPRVLGVMRGD